MSASITISGAAELAALLSQDLDEALTPVFVGLAQQAQGMLAQYPPSRGTYRRTGAYGNSFQTTRLPRGARLVNLASYGGYVGGENQASMHAGRWKNVTEVAASIEASGLPRQLVEDVLRAKFGGEG